MINSLLFLIDLGLAALVAYGLTWLGARVLQLIGREGGDGGPGGGWRRPGPTPPPRPHGSRTDVPPSRRAPLSGGRIAP